MIGKMTANVLLTQSLSVELGSAEPWPQDVALYQTYEVKRGQTCRTPHPNHGS